MLAMRNVHVRLGGSRLLTDVSLAVASGEVVAVVGPNGAGKTTLLKAACGDVVPTGGEVVLNDRRLQAWHRRERARIMAVLPQESTLAFPFTVLEVVMMGRTPHDTGSKQDQAIARAALEAAGMAAFQERIYPTLSGGERQRVHVARVLAQVWEEPVDGPRYLLLDEPTASLDLAYQHHTLETFRQFAARGAGVLAVLHDLNLAAQFADRIVVLRDGHQLACGCPRAVLTPGIIQAAFAFAATVMPHPSRACPLVVS